MVDMRRGLDFEKAEAALKRAAHKALHGTREERSGRYTLAKTNAVSSSRASKRSKINRHKG
jgi:hypothetical protein